MRDDAQILPSVEVVYKHFHMQVLLLYRQQAPEASEFQQASITVSSYSSPTETHTGIMTQYS